MSFVGKNKVSPSDGTIGTTAQQVSKKVGLSTRTLERAKKVIELAPKSFKKPVGKDQKIDQ